MFLRTFGPNIWILLTEICNPYATLSLYISILYLWGITEEKDQLRLILCTIGQFSFREFKALVINSGYRGKNLSPVKTLSASLNAPKSSLGGKFFCGRF